LAAGGVSKAYKTEAGETYFVSGGADLVAAEADLIAGDLILLLVKRTKLLEKLIL
jgi:hypothetical protein